MVQELFPGGQKRARILFPGQTAFLALDLQRYFLHPESHAFIPSAVPILSRINELSRLFRERSRPVIFSQHTNTRENAGNMGTWWRELLTTEHPLYALDSRVSWERGEILRKSQYDAFYRTDLEGHLKEFGVSQVVVGGVMAHLCCESTARSAFVRGFEVFFLVDCTAAYTRAHHLAALRNLGHGFATLITSPELERVFQEEGR